ncbi:MAG TPA: hypothetical protein VG916_10900 [Gemmatimonadaceae bacterium]|nr:hypothetical protein [Gemmatimonadaceae bacterium]
MPAIVSALAVATPSLAAAQVPADSTIVRATAGPDTTQRFAIYLPPGYSARRRWPTILILDPRGRAIAALERFRPAAARRGYVLISSWNSLSDGPVAPNVGAINAMLTAARTTVAADLTRLYVAGMSGTARLAWTFELEAPALFAGIFAASAAPALDEPGSPQLLRSPGFAFVMTAGTRDFNFSEVAGAVAPLRSVGAAASVEFFDGPHDWPPAPLVERGVEWFTVRAMLGGRAPADSAWIDAQRAAALHRADSLLDARNLAAAADAYRRAADEFAGWRAVDSTNPADSTTARAARIEALPAVIAYRRAAAALDRDEHDRATDLLRRLVDVRRDSTAHDGARLARQLGLAAFVKLAASGDSLRGPSADRVLAYARAMLASMSRDRISTPGSRGAPS